MLEWFECLSGSGCYSAKANGFMAHIQPYSLDTCLNEVTLLKSQVGEFSEAKAWLWNWNKHTGIALTLEDAKREVEQTIEGLS